jgi:hypothetical protein
VLSKSYWHHREASGCHRKVTDIIEKLPSGVEKLLASSRSFPVPSKSYWHRREASRCHRKVIGVVEKLPGWHRKAIGIDEKLPGGVEKLLASSRSFPVASKSFGVIEKLPGGVEKSLVPSRSFRVASKSYWHHREASCAIERLLERGEKHTVARLRLDGGPKLPAWTSMEYMTCMSTMQPDPKNKSKAKKQLTNVLN